MDHVALAIEVASHRGLLWRDGNEAVIRIDDDDPGIPVDHMDALFEPFVRGDKSRCSATGGTGLGLSIAGLIIRSHGGSITLLNREHGGLSATVRLPCNSSDGH